MNLFNGLPLNFPRTRFHRNSKYILIYELPLNKDTGPMAP